MHRSPRLALPRSSVARSRACVWLAALALLALLAACSAEPLAPIRFPKIEIVAQASVPIDAARGGEVSLGGARIVVPPGALAEPATLTLIETSIPLGELAEDDGAWGGDVPLWPHGFVIASDRPVELRSAITLELPIDRERLPVDRGDGDVRVSAVVGGYLVLQGPAPGGVSGDRVEIPIDAPALPEGPPFTSTPRGFGSVPFLVVVGGLLGAGANLQALVASVDSARAGFLTLETEHFTIRYRSTATSTATEIAETLEAAHALYVTRLGFALPRLLSSWSRYTFYIDDFANHLLAQSSAGMTLPGSFLANGASYLDVGEGSAGNDPHVTTAHEYFHAVSYGVLSRWVPNAAGVASDREANWLFEGPAALMGARVAAGDAGTTLDVGLEEHPPPLRSIYAEPGPGEPPADAAQELFFHLERSLGTIDHYRPMFERLGTDVPLVGSTEPSVVAVDSVLRERGTSLGEAYGEWVRDYLFDDPASYGRDPPPGPTLRAQDPPAPERDLLPPLSYAHYRFVVPADTSGTASRDVTVRLTVERGSPFDVVLFASAGGLAEELQPIDAGAAETLLLTAVRSTETDREVRVAIANRGSDVDDEVTVEVALVLDCFDDTSCGDRVCRPDYEGVPRCLALCSGSGLPCSEGACLGFDTETPDVFEYICWRGGGTPVGGSCTTNAQCSRGSWCFSYAGGPYQCRVACNPGSDCSGGATCVFSEITGSGGACVVE